MNKILLIALCVGFCVIQFFNFCKDDGKDGKLFFGKIMWINAIFSALFGLLFYPDVLLLTAIFILVAICCILIIFTTHGEFDEQKIEFTTLFSGTNIQYWHDLIEVNKSLLVKGFYFKFRDGSIIRISNALTGIEQLYKIKIIGLIYTKTMNKK